MIEISDITKARPLKVAPRPLEQRIQWTAPLKPINQKITTPINTSSLVRRLPYQKGGTSRVARLARLETKTRNLTLLRSSWLQNFYLATFWLFCNSFVPQIFLGGELRVVRVACPRQHKTGSGPPYSCVMLDEHPNIPKKR